MTPDPLDLAVSITVADLLTTEGDAESTVLELESHELLKRALSLLSDREVEVLLMRHDFDLHQHEVARVLGVSPARVYQIEHRAMSKLREKFSLSSAVQSTL